MSFFGIEQIIAFMSQNGYLAYLAIFILMLSESTIIPIPSEVVLPFAGVLIAIGAINPVLGFLDAVIASLIGNLIAFSLGYVFGIDVVYKYGKKFGFKMDAYMRGERWIKKYGNAFAFICKLLPVVRSFSSVVCGAFKMNTKKFIVYTTAGVAIWSAALMYIGFAFTNNWQSISDVIIISSPYIGVAAIIMLLFLTRRWILHWIRTLYKAIAKSR